ncbi:hypothetical protein C5167_001750 [Papaver somniferum]|uniref:Annexin n=1 Tax=Papaver somniferum TaxID=3469 RepID=A0A4Y7KZM6_PAPSO|nr:hypothetical protein C5167_001750 [Papaver somniferum]
MADEIGVLTKAFSGFGVDERSIISILGKWHPEEKKSFRKGCPNLFQEDHRDFEKWDQNYIHTLEHEFARFKLLVALVSAYRYEGAKVNDTIAKSEAKILGDAIKNVDRNPIEDDEVVMILSTRSKTHLKVVFDHYKELYGNDIQEDLHDESILKEAVICLTSPQLYFAKVLDMALAIGANENTKEGLTRVIVTRADTDMKEIKEQYANLYGVQFLSKIEELTSGNFKDFLLALIQRSE